MTFTNPQDQVHNSNVHFSPDTFRDAMGPGYQAATFREQPALMPTTPPVRTSFDSTPRRSDARLETRPWTPVLLAVASLLLRRAVSRFRPSPPVAPRPIGPACC